MLLEECLQRIGTQELRQIAVHHNIDDLGHSKNRLYQALVGMLRQREVVHNSVAKLSIDQRKLLKLICLFWSNNHLDQYLLERMVLEVGMANHSYIDLLKRLKVLGLMFEMTSENYHRVLILPDEIYAHLSILFDHEISSSLVCGFEPETYRQDHGLLLVDMLRVMTLVQDGQIRQTGQRIMYKKSRQLIQKIFLGQGDARQINGYQENDSRFILIWTFLKYRNMVTADDANIFHVSANWNAWLEKEDWLKLDDVFMFWKKDLYWGRTSQVYTTLLCRLFANPTLKGWVSVESLARTYHELFPRFNIAKSYQQWFEQLLWHLVYMGILSIGSVNHIRVVRLTKWGKDVITPNRIITEQIERPTFFYCQPNFQLLVPQESQLQQLWKIGQFADMEQGDQMLVYRLSQKSIYRALRLGWTTQAINDFLKTYSQHALPQNVIVSVEQWGEKFGQMYVLETCLLRCQNEQIAKEIQASQKLAPWIIGALNETDLMIKRDDYQKLLNLLCKEGYMPYQTLYQSETDPGFK